MLRRGVFASHPCGHILTPPEPICLQTSRPSPPEGFPDRSTWTLPDPRDARSEDLSPRKFTVRLQRLYCNKKVALRCNFLWISFGSGEYLWVTCESVEYLWITYRLEVERHVPQARRRRSGRIRG